MARRKNDRYTAAGGEEEEEEEDGSPAGLLLYGSKHVAVTILSFLCDTKLTEARGPFSPVYSSKG